MYPVVVSDLDGTLLNKDHKISARTADVVRRLSQQGIKFIFATGRHYDDVEFIRASLGVDMYLITSNGARVHDPKGNLIIEHNIDSELVRPLLDLRKEHEGKVHSNVYHQQDWLVELETEELLAFSGDSGFAYTLMNLDDTPDTEVQKIFFVSREHEDLVPLANQAQALFGDRLSLTFSLPYCFEIMGLGVCKSTALKEVLKLKGYGLDDVVAFGDGLNDLRMLDQVGKGVIMGNADKRLVEQLPDNEQIGFNHDDAVAEYLENSYLN